MALKRARRSGSDAEVAGSTFDVALRTRVMGAIHPALVAGLNHPNIPALYDVGTENGISYIVTDRKAHRSETLTFQYGRLRLLKP